MFKLNSKLVISGFIFVSFVLLAQKKVHVHQCLLMWIQFKILIAFYEGQRWDPHRAIMLLNISWQLASIKFVHFTS